MKVTVDYLLKQTKKFKAHLFTNAQTVTMQNLKVTNWKGTRTKLFSGTMQDRVKTGSTRNAYVFFTVPKDVDMDHYKPSMSKDLVRVRSTSPFYRYAFQYNNKRIKAHYGPVKDFSVKGTGRPTNPKNFPGLDKHLIAFINVLHKSKQITA